ncbi:MAG: type III-B CRISPR-associated protein Cas10/Cmr2 [Fimbriimonadaceae bacterium]|nr:type III-B CRISPR-associated protein Cas10/Cmr2 [Fimbriimonadaceae bacterium]
MKYLVQISLGPVQGFIAASRKTRDLAVGSALLAKLSQVAAEELGRQGASLIFPPDASQPAANILLATLESDPKSAAEGAKAKVLARLKEEVATGARDAGVLVDPSADLTEQAEKLLEWFAAWAPITNDDFAAARKRVGALMAGRKATRDFPPAPADDGRPKSPLDPSFPGVLRVDGRTYQVRTETDVRVKPREHLDAVGLVKRFGTFEGVAKRYASTREIAVGMGALSPEETNPLLELERMLKGHEGLCDVDEALFGETDGLPPELKAQVDAEVKAIRFDRKPRPYYCVLHGDGDAMGKLLDHLSQQGETALRGFSVALSGFASKVHGIVTQHHGVCVYAGGDDVVALAPMDTAVELAKAVQQAFDATMKTWADGLTPKPDLLPTFTMGVAAVHVMDNLQESVKFAQLLEKRGKKEDFGDNRKKNALVVGAKPRSGGEVCVAGRWDDQFADRFVAHREHLREGRLPRGFPYEMRALAQELTDFAKEPTMVAMADELAAMEVARILRKKQADRDYAPPPIASVAELRRYADMLLVAHFFTREGE